jgi:hypothetical protein
VLALLALAIGSPTAIYNAIIEEMRSGNLATACVQAADLAKSHPTFFGGFHLLGICETQRGKLEAASLQFQRCLDLNPLCLPQIPSGRGGRRLTLQVRCSTSHFSGHNRKAREIPAPMGNQNEQLSGRTA